MAKLVIVEGDAYVRTEHKTTVLTTFLEEFILDDAVATLQAARSIIRKGLISDRLRGVIGNFKKVRTLQVVSFEATDKKAENKSLDKLLVKAVGLDCVPDMLDSYTSVDGKERALSGAIEVAEARVKKAKKPKDVEDQGYVD